MASATKKKWAFVASAFTVLALVIGTGACAEVSRPTCYAGDYLACACSADVRGFAACGDDGRYGACVCDGRTPGVDGSVGDAAVEADVVVDAAKVGFMGICVKNEDCDTGLFCKDFPSRGTFCTRNCTTATAPTDCPAPSPGCNKDGICKAP